MTHTLVDNIVRNILANQSSVGMQAKVAISRPNYQRNSGQVQVRTSSIKPSEATQTFSANVDINSQVISTSQAVSRQVTTNLPSGALFVLSLNPMVTTSIIKRQATEIELSPVNNNIVQVKPEYIQKTAAKSKEFTSNAKILGQAQFIDTAAGHTLGYVIPNLDRGLIEALNTNYRAVGVISSRQGAAAQIMAVDEAVKKTNSTIIKLQLAKDDFGGTGHGVFILLGADDVTDVTQAVQIALNFVDQFQENIIHNHGGKIETHFSARAAGALNIAFGAPINQAFGIIIGAPAGVGFLMSDTALKSAPVTAVILRGPSAEQAFANEVWLTVTGDSASVKNALESAREVGTKVLSEFRS